MGLRISTNVAAAATQRNLRTHTGAEQSSLEKLSAGSRIVHAGDDAAGLAISEKMRADIRSSRQAVRNTNDGISMVQVAEGAMAELSNSLVRIRELAIQAASDTVGDTERGFSDKEVQQLLLEMGRVAKTTEFNGQSLLSSDARFLEIQTGIHNDPDNDVLYYDLMVGNSMPQRLGLDGIGVSSREQARGTLSIVDHAMNRVSKNRTTLGSLQNRMISAVNNGEIYTENLAASHSRIRDVDVASETAELTKNKILTDSAVAVLSQANQDGRLALKLLG